jgi:hypothetical protein
MHPDLVTTIFRRHMTTLVSEAKTRRHGGLKKTTASRGREFTAPSAVG